MAMPYPMLQPPLYQHASSLMPTDLLNAIEALDSRWATPSENNRSVLPGLSPGLLLPHATLSSEVARRMGLEGGPLECSNPLRNGTGQLSNQLRRVHLFVTHPVHCLLSSSIPGRPLNSSKGNCK